MTDDITDGIPTEKYFNILRIANEVSREVMRATRMYLPLNSPHEAHSVIEEEFDEFWDEVKTYNLRKGRDTRSRMREELIQLAAMAIRAVTDVIDFGKPTGETRVFHDQGNATNHTLDQCGPECGTTDATPVQAAPTVG